MLHIPYEKQLQEKQGVVENLFSDYSANAQIHPIIGMDDPYHYRNKVTSPFVSMRTSLKHKSSIACGMYKKGTHRVVDTSECLIENMQAKRIILSIRSLMYTYHIEPYDEDRDIGFMRHAQIRVGFASGEIMVTLVTRNDQWKHGKSFARALVKKHPEITTVIQNIHTSTNNVILGAKEKTLYGPGFILDSLCGLSFRISSRSFYQVNVGQTQYLYERAVEMAKLSGKETIFDAYCGTGTIGLVAMAGVHGLPGGHRLIGVEERRDAIADAYMNTRHNGIKNVEFIAGDAGAYMRSLARQNHTLSGVIDVVFMDPPRAGATLDFLKATIQLEPTRIVYISCNPKTQIRDAKYLIERGYVLKELQVVDMFPHTDGIESIIMLERMTR
ncbi:MAG: 23S rRNA (uracil(1939)-C(5))-methyltransferase RlmD [Eggerthellaceae bacterium]|nr:23S rRNA (uracil(1939)-C(5))-methyltransferase RlmD [Eggerthellaceae bacterium]